MELTKEQIEAKIKALELSNQNWAGLNKHIIEKNNHEIEKLKAIRAPEPKKKLQIPQPSLKKSTSSTSTKKRK